MPHCSGVIEHEVLRGIEDASKVLGLFRVARGRDSIERRRVPFDLNGVEECRTSAIMGHIWEVENPRV